MAERRAAIRSTRSTIVRVRQVAKQGALAAVLRCTPTRRHASATDTPAAIRRTHASRCSDNGSAPTRP